MFLAASQAKAACLCCSKPFPELGQPPTCIRAVLSTQSNPGTEDGTAQGKGICCFPATWEGIRNYICWDLKQNGGNVIRGTSKNQTAPLSLGVLHEHWYLKTSPVQEEICVLSQELCHGTINGAAHLSQSHAADLRDDKYC